jgi:uncharacterized Fe-S cluster-containing protein
MVSLYLTKCHKILDHHKVEVVVVIVDSTHRSTISAESIELKVSKILMFVISGEKDILKDNETYFYYIDVSYIWWRH